MTREKDHTELLSHINTTLANGHTIPCVSNRNVSWISDAPKEQAKAADLCRQCPLILRCHNYLETHGERAGVWAGLTMKHRSAATGKPKN